MIRFEDLFEKVRGYSPDADVELLRRAYVFSAMEHKGQVRHSGEPYLVHPLEVAGLLAELKLDESSIVTGLLHDTIEDTLATIESHNHPSAVEPFQGAATGVGGIIRDIFTMGSRPLLGFNSLRFGPIEGDSAEAAQNWRWFAGVVAGIAHYGNCIGIPTVGGEVYFDESYNGNPLVNAFCLGVLRHEQITRGAAKGVGNPVFYVGPATGRDGLAGAAFASQDLTEESADQQRGAVQVGDPFMEKLVCKACLELLATGAVAGIQDMGAAGLTCIR